MSEPIKAGLVASIRELADRIERSEIPGETRASLSISFYGVHEIETLKAIVATWDEGYTADKSRGTHWLDGSVGDHIKTTAFYKPGLLGNVRKKKTVVRETESTPDLSRLKS